MSVTLNPAAVRRGTDRARAARRQAITDLEQEIAWLEHSSSASDKVKAAMGRHRLAALRQAELNDRNGP